MKNFIEAGLTSVRDLAAKLWLSTLEVAGAVFSFRVEVVTLRGPLRRGTDEDVVTLLYVGRGSNLLHFKNKFYKEVSTVQSTKTNLLSFRKHMNAAEASADVVFVDIGQPYNGLLSNRDAYLALPDWVCMVAPIKETWDETVQNFRKTMRKNIRRLIRKNGYELAPTNDPAIIGRFYEDFYKPFINSRHSDEAVLTPQFQIEKYARRGVILQVIGADGPVAAGVYFSHDKTLYLLDAGMPQSHIDNPPEAAMSALYYFSMYHAFDNGLTSINFMGTRPFPTNGLFQFKRKWGAAVEDSFSTNSIYFKPVKTSMGAARFCELFPFIARRSGKLELIICSTSEDLDASGYDRLVAESYCEGIDTVRIVHLTEQRSEAVSHAAQEPTVRVAHTTLDTFSEDYIRKGTPG